jgi:hypothetical protein
VFRVEVEHCPVPDCGGRMKLRYLAKTERAAERRMVELGLAPRPPPPPPLPGQLRLPLAG